MYQKTIDIPSKVWSMAPFTISHYDEAWSWSDSPILRSLMGQTVIILDSNGMEFCGDVASIEQDGMLLTPAIGESGWDSVFVKWLNVKHIYLC